MYNPEDFDNVTGNFPNVIANDVSGPGEVDGTEYSARIIDNGIFGWQQALLDSADMTPNDTDEAAGSSQILDAIKKISSSWAKNWTVPSITSYDRFGIASDGNITVICGGDPSDVVTQYSYDGINWYDVVDASIGKHATGIAYGNGYWVMTTTDDGAGGNIYYDTDPTGTFSYNNISNSYLNAVAYGNGYFVAVGDSGALYYATDPSGTWTSNTQGSSDLHAVHYDATEDVWVIVGADGVIYTRDTNPTGSFTLNDQGSQTFYDVTKGLVCGVATWVVVGASNVIMTASDPSATWTARTSQAVSGTSLNGVTYGNGVFIAVGSNGSGIEGDGIQISYNAVDWEVVPCDFEFNAVGYHFDQFICVGEDSDIVVTNRHG